jgi:tetratricopeptide (TPR) repeat protein
MNPNRILVGCAVKENNVEYTNLETEYLFKTLDTFGGNLKNVKKIACFTEKPNSFFENILTKMGVKIRINNKLDQRQSFANKINILEEGIKEDVDVIVMLDTDIVVARDFSEFLDTKKILIKPEDRDPFSLTDWKQLFDYFKINFPSERFHTSCSHQETVPYFNGGVIIIPKVFAKEFLDQWKYFLKKLLDEKLNLPMNFITNPRFFDQIAFSLTLIQLKLPYDILPLSMNYPYSGTVHSSENPQSLDPFIIHHHHCILETGDLMHCPYDNINSKIDEVNEYLTNVRKIRIEKESLVSVISIRNLTMIKEFEKVTERLSDLPLDDPNPSLQYYLALSLHNTKKNFDEALIRYTKALELGFTDYMVYADRGWLYYMMGDVKNATKDLIKSFTINPHDMETKKRLARLDPRIDQIKLLCDKKSFDDIIKILSGVKLDDSNPFLQYYLNHLASDKLLKYATPEIQYFLQMIKNKDAYLLQMIKDKDAYLEQSLKDKDAYLEQAIKQYQDTIDQIRASKSWRITHPFFKKI